MATKNLRNAFSNSLKAEEEAIKSRFERAETALARSTTPPVPSAVPDLSALPGDDGMRVKRDSFTMPLSDYEAISVLQKRCMKLEIRASKSEILRAGLAVLSTLNDKALIEIIDGLSKVKTGRPPSNGNTI